jgi:hypothetical protein
MQFDLPYQSLSAKEKTLVGFFGFLPGFVSWTIIIGLLIVAFSNPFLGAKIIIALLVYWLIRLIYLAIFLILSYKWVSYGKEISWMERVKGLDDIYGYWKKLNIKREEPTFKNKFLFAIHREEIKALEKTKLFPPALKDIYHLVLVTLSCDTSDDVDQAIATISRGDFPPERILLVVVLEEQYQTRFKGKLHDIKKKYGEKFLDFLIIKGTLNPAAKEATQYFKDKGIPFLNVIVSNFAADSTVNHDYLSCLSYKYMVNPDRNRVCFQSIPMYHNTANLESILIKPLYLGSSFLKMAQAVNTDRAVAFSNYSIGLKALIALDYWPQISNPDKAAIFWKGFTAFSGSFKVIPMYLPSYIRIHKIKTSLKTIGYIYKQQKNLARAIENFPYLAGAVFESGRTLFFQKAKQTLIMLEEHIYRATWAIVLGILSLIPVYLVGRDFSSAILYYSAFRLMAIIIILVALNFICCILIALLQLPARKEKLNLFKGMAQVVGFVIIFPITLVLSTVSALEVQTKLMLGKRRS